MLVLVVPYVLSTFRDYGLSWDEEHSAQNGALTFAWFASLGRDGRVLTESNHRLYGAFFDLVSNLAARLSPLGSYETGHLLVAACGWLGLLSTFRLGRAVGGSRAGFFALVCLALTPVYVGHAFMNPKDVPLAALFVTAAFYLVRAADELPAPRGATLAKLAIMTGLAAGVRVIGTFLLGYWALAIAAWWIGAVASRHPRPSLAEIAGWWWKPALGAWLLMVVFWPYAQVNPIANPVRAFFEASRFQWPGTVLFEDATIPASDLPWRYLPTWFAISMPEFYAAGLAAGIVPAVAFLARDGRGRRWTSALHVILLVIAAVLPPALATWTHAVCYDGMRHFLFTVPFLAVLAGWGLSAGIGQLAALRARATIARWLGAVVVAPLVAAGLASLAITVVDMHDLHPYEYIYFNRLVAGGEEAAAPHFETDYWGLSYKEGLEWLRASYPRGKGRTTVGNVSAEFLTTYWIRSDPELSARFIGESAYTTPPPRIVLATTRWGRHREPGTVLHVVTRKNVPLCYVIEHDDPPPAHTTQ
jgi:hypothetical protein